MSNYKLSYGTNCDIYTSEKDTLIYLRLHDKWIKYESETGVEITSEEAQIKINE